MLIIVILTVAYPDGCNIKTTNRKKRIVSLYFTQVLWHTIIFCENKHQALWKV